MKPHDDEAWERALRGDDASLQDPVEAEEARLVRAYFERRLAEEIEPTRSAGRQERLQRFLAERLESVRLPDVVSPSPESPSGVAGLLSGLLKMFTEHRWLMGGLAGAAVAVLVGVALVPLNSRVPDFVEPSGGGFKKAPASLLLRVGEPIPAAQALEQALKDAGASVEVTPQEKSAVLTVTVPPNSRQSIATVLAARGLERPEGSMFVVIVRQ